MKTTLDHRRVVSALRNAQRRGADRQALLELTASAIHDAGPPYTGVYLYMRRGNALELEAFAGDPTDHISIPIGQGLCGRAVREARDLNVPDVRGEPEYLACSLTTQSELICLLQRGEMIIGQIDIDSDAASAFSPEEEAAVRAVADILQELL